MHKVVKMFVFFLTLITFVPVETFINVDIIRQVFKRNKTFQQVNALKLLFDDKFILILKKILPFLDNLTFSSF